MFWVLHTGQQHLPGRVIAPPRFATYRTHANPWRARCRTPTASGGPTVPLAPSRLTPEATNEPNVAPHATKTACRTTCIALHIASSPRALVATRTARLSDRHA
eukprot:3159016-Pleurochrysis_carterae.AAC.1